MLIPRSLKASHTLLASAIAAALGLTVLSLQAQEEKPQPEARPETREAGEKPTAPSEKPGPSRERTRPEGKPENKPEGRPEGKSKWAGRPEAGRDGDRPSPRRDGASSDAKPRDGMTQGHKPHVDNPHGKRGRSAIPARSGRNAPSGAALPHLRAAAGHLEAAGLHDEALRLRARVGEMQRQQYQHAGESRPPHRFPRLEAELKEIRQNHEELRAEVEKLREELRQPRDGGPKKDQRGSGQ